VIRKKQKHVINNYIFDFDGTLIDSFPAMLQIFNENIRNQNDPLEVSEIEQLRNMTSRRAIKALGIRWWQIPKLLLRGMPDFYKMIPKLKSFDGLPEVIKTMYERGDRLFIVTSNTHESVDGFLKLQELDGYFTEIMTGSGLFKKAKHIRKLIKMHHLKRKETVYIGDETRDIQAARLARIKCISVTWGFNSRQILVRQRPHKLVDNPKDLLSLNL
jgi:phosphoglycolate phosphatase